MAAVKPSNLAITDLVMIGSIRLCRRACRLNTHAGTAGVILDFSDALGVIPSLSSFSKTVLPLGTIRRDAIVANIRIPLSHQDFLSGAIEGKVILGISVYPFRAKCRFQRVCRPPHLEPQKVPTR